MSAAFDLVFGVFVAAILALGVVAIRWALRRDRVARARQADRNQTPDAVSPAGSGTSGEKGSS